MPDTRLHDAFVDVLDDAPPSTIAISRAMTDGQRIVRTRRIAVTGSSAFAVLLMLAGLMTVLHPGAHRQPSPSGSSLPPTIKPSPSPGASVPYVIGNVVTLPNHTQVVLDAASDAFVTVVQTPDGLVFSTDTAVWFRSNAGTTRKISTMDGDFAVSRDGKAVIVTVTSSRITAFALPGGAALRSTDFFEGSMGTRVLDVAGDWALITAFNGGPGAGRATAWNFKTGTTKPTGGDMWALGITSDGRIVRGIDNGGKPLGTERTKTCYDVASANNLKATGYCANPIPDGAAAAFALSPDGKWLAAPEGWNGEGGSAAVLKVPDLHRGVLNQTRTPPTASGVIVFFETNTTFIMRGPKWYECTISGSCTTLTVPTNAQVIQVVGGD